MTGSHLCSYDFQVLYIIVLRKREHPQIWLLYSLLIFEQGIETNSRIRQDAKARLKKKKFLHFWRVDERRGIVTCFCLWFCILHRFFLLLCVWSPCVFRCLLPVNQLGVLPRTAFKSLCAHSSTAARCLWLHRHAKNQWWIGSAFIVKCCLTKENCSTTLCLCFTYIFYVIKNYLRQTNLPFFQKIQNKQTTPLCHTIFIVVYDRELVCVW